MLLSNGFQYFGACSLSKVYGSPSIHPSLDTYDWPNQTQAAVLVAHCTGGMNYFRPCFLGKILLKIISDANMLETEQKAAFISHDCPSIHP